MDRPTATITVKAPNVPLPAVADGLAGAAGDRRRRAGAAGRRRAARRRRVVAPQPGAGLSQQIATQAGFSADLRAGPGPPDRQRHRRRRQDAGRGARRAARRGEAAGRAAGFARRARQGQDAAPDPGLQHPADAARPGRGDRRGGRARRQPEPRQHRPRRPAAGSAPPTCSGCCAATSPARTASRSTTCRKGRRNEPRPQPSARLAVRPRAAARGDGRVGPAVRDAAAAGRAAAAGDRRPGRAGAAERPARHRRAGARACRW